MGNESSRNDDQTSSYSAFSEEERQQMTDILGRICGENRKTFSVDQLQKHLKSLLDDPYSSRIFNYMLILERGGGKESSKSSSSKHSPEVGQRGFVGCMAHMLKGNFEQQSDVVMALCGDANVKCLKNLLKMVTVQCINSLQAAKQSETRLRFRAAFGLEEFLSYFIHELIYPGGKQQFEVKESTAADATFTKDSVEKLLFNAHLLKHVFHQTYHRWFPIGSLQDSSPLIPNCSDEGVGSRDFQSLLDMPSVMFINSFLPHELRHNWRLLFSSSLHGDSFATLLQKITDKGPTVITICDQSDHMFGGFTPVSWNPQGTFYGTNRCFLFSIRPIMDVYMTTAINKNYVYLNYNQKTLPNGLGMGGQLGYFGFWLDQEYGTGHCKANPKCTTYGSPCLSKEEKFSIKSVEVWGVGADPMKEKKKGLSMQNMDIETKAILSMMDKRLVSEGWTETESVETTDAPPSTNG